MSQPLVNLALVTIGHVELDRSVRSYWHDDSWLLDELYYLLPLHKFELLNGVVLQNDMEA